jgi:hypothetical protein
MTGLLNYFLPKNSIETQPVGLWLTGATISMASQTRRRKGCLCLLFSLGRLGGSVTDGFCGNRAGGSKAHYTNGTASNVGVKSYFHLERGGFRNRTPSPVPFSSMNSMPAVSPNGLCNWLRFAKKGTDVFRVAHKLPAEARAGSRLNVRSTGIMCRLGVDPVSPGSRRDQAWGAASS